MSAAVVDRLGKQSTVPWPAAVARAQGQEMGASSAKSCKMQLEHGFTNGTTKPARLSPSLYPLEQPLSHIPTMNTSQKQHRHTSYTGMPAQNRTCTHYSVLPHTCMLVRLCYGHKH